MVVKVRKYLFNQLVALDQSVNTLFGGAPDETISSRAGKAMNAGKKWGCVLCKFLDFFDKDHCLKNIENDEGDK